MRKLSIEIMMYFTQENYEKCQVTVKNNISKLLIYNSDCTAYIIKISSASKMFPCFNTITTTTLTTTLFIIPLL